MFNSSNFGEIDYLYFDKDFNIDLGDKIKILFGPNGVGKSSIYNNIKKNHSDFKFIDYEDVKDSVISQKKKILIGASIVELDKKIVERNSIIDSTNIIGNLKEFGIKSTAIAKKISNNMEDLRKNPMKAILSFSDDNLINIFSLSDVNQKFFVDNAVEFISCEEINVEVLQLKEIYKKRVFENLFKLLEESEFVCPICGNLSDEPIKDLIVKKINQIEAIDNKLIDSYRKLYPELSPEDVITNIKVIKGIISDNNILISNVENFCLTGGDYDNVAIIIDSKKRIQKLELEIQNLEIKKEEFYNNLKNNKEKVISIFKSQFFLQDENIVFDDSSKVLSLVFQRDIESYSTGEINLMTFVISILEFISSDKDTLIIDDPLSSYDIPNQYRIIYEIASAKSYSKRILIFTHNIDTINIANSQYNKLFEYQMIERINKTLFLNTINYSSGNELLSISNLLANVDSAYPHLSYLELLINKDELPDDDDKHLIFHYDYPISINNGTKKYENNYLVNLIDNFDNTTLQCETYITNTINKIVYMAALRVWIEKQFFDNLSGDPNLCRKLLGDKIVYVFNNNKWTGSNSVTKEYLMSKKVMLNQQVHSHSQRLPFYFSLNLSLDDVILEIIDIKKHFLV